MSAVRSADSVDKDGRTFYHLINNFLTSGITSASPDTIRRIRVLNLFELVFVIAAPSLGLFYFYIGAYPLFFISAVAGLLGVGTILLLRITRNPDLASNCAVFIFWSTILIIRWKTGGMSGDGLMLLSWVWNGTVILLAIFLIGYKGGAIWACLVFIESGFCMFLYKGGHSFTNLIPPAISTVYSLGSYLTGLLTILLFAFLFAKERDDARMRENDKLRMLIESRRYIESIVERLPLPTFVLDNNHRVIQWNRACHEITGIAPQEILGNRVWDGFSLDEEGSLADKLLDSPAVLAEEYSDSIISRTESGSFSIDTLLPNLKGGVQAIVNTAPIVDYNGMVKGAVQTIQDIGRRNEGSGEAPTFADDKVDYPGYPVFKIDMDGKISGWNKACEESFGYSRSHILGSNPLTIISKPYRKDFQDTVKRVFKGESLKGKQWKFYMHDGEPIYILAGLYPLISLSEKIQGCVVMCADITEIRLKVKRLERYAVESREKLRKLKESYDLLKSNVASFIRKKSD